MSEYILKTLQGIIATGALFGVLTGCSAARVTESASSGVATSSPPVEILVDVSAVPGADDAQGEVATEVAGPLQSALLEKLTASRITAEPFVSGTRHPGAALLRVTITRADQGDAIKRFVVGFGAGRAELQVAAEFERSDSTVAGSMTAFNVSSDSGKKAGLIVPGAIARAARDAVPLAIGGSIDVASSVHGGLSKPVQKTSTAIVGELEKYYARVGWAWPGRGA